MDETSLNMSNFRVFLAPFFIIINSSQFDYAEFEKIGFILCWDPYFYFTVK